MDKTDYKILEILKKNGRATVSEISRSVNLSLPAVSERIRKMEESGTIEYYTLKINRDITGDKLLTVIFVSIDKTKNIGEFRDRVVKFNEVLECHHIVGEYDYMLKVLLKDTRELEEFITDKLKSIRGVHKSNTLLILSTLKEEVNRGGDLL